MAQSIEDLISPWDPDKALRDFLRIVQIVTGAPTDAWEPGDIAYDLSDTVTTWVCDQFNTWVVPGIRSQFLRFSSGSWLTYKAWTDYDRPQTEATFAVGDVEIENRGTFVGTVAAQTLRIQAASGKSYTNTRAVFVPLWSGSGAYPFVTFNFQADEAGSASNALPNALPVYPTPLRASPDALLFVRTNAALLGSDAESEALSRQRCQLAAAERGQSPRQYLESVALDPIGAMRRAKLPIPSTWPRSVNITRVRLEEPGSGVIRVWLAALSGAAAGSTSSADTDVFIANTAIQLLAVPPGGSCVVGPAVEVPIAYGVITLSIKREANVDKPTAEATANAALLAFWQGLPVGGERKTVGGQGYALIDHVRSVAMTGPGAYEATFAGVSVDTALAPSEVAVPSYTASATIVAQGT